MIGTAGKPRTLLAYRYVANDFILPHIGGLSAPAVKADDVRKLFTTLRGIRVRRKGRPKAGQEKATSPDAPFLSSKTLGLNLYGAP